MAQHILVVDDDALMRRSLTLSLEQAGYRATPAGSAEAALTAAEHDPPDLILLDIGLPGMDGLEALGHFRQRVAAPIIFVTARRRELDTILALEMGGDDYITKPFNPDVLLAHIKAVLRRTGDAPSRPTALVVGDLVIDREAHSVTLAGRPVELGAREFELLLALAEAQGEVVPAETLLDRVWGETFTGEPQTLYVYIRWLREKLETDPQHPQRIVTVRGVGYRLALPHETSP